MSGTVLDHRLVRGNLRDLEAAMRGLPAAQARELREQITAHLDDALGPDADDQEVAAVLSRRGSPAGLAAEAGAASGSPGSRSALGGRRARWWLATVIAVPAVTAVVLGALQISSVVSSYVTSGRDQHLARLNAAVVTLTQDLEDERDLSAGYAARRQAGLVPVTLAHARRATDKAASIVRADAAGVGAAYQPDTVQDLDALLASITYLGYIRKELSSPVASASQVIRVYTDNVIEPATTFSAEAGGGTGDASLQGTVTTLAALLRVENHQSVQRAILYAALSAQPPVLSPDDLASLKEADVQAKSDLADFGASANTAEQEHFSTVVSGRAVDDATSQRIEAEQKAAASPSAPLTGTTGLDAATWYGNMSTTVGDTRKVAGQLAGQITVRTDTLRSNATRSLLFTSLVALLLVVLLLSAALARLLARPLGKLRSDALGAVTR